MRIICDETSAIVFPLYQFFQQLAARSSTAKPQKPAPPALPAIFGSAGEG
jgi:hypothetical protein